MKKIENICCALVIVILICGGGCNYPSFKSGDSIDAFSVYLDEHIPKLIKQYDIPGVSMALVQNGEIVWSGAYGYADIKHKRRMTTDAICRVESISKSVTAWGVMLLAENGHINLDEPAQKYLNDFELPQSKDPAEQITVRRLLSGNAGLPLGTIGKNVEYDPRGEIPTLQNYLSNEVRLIREPGSGFMYSNVGFNLLELIVEEVEGRDFSLYMKDEILTPMDMQNSSFSWDESFHSAIPTGYDSNGGEVPTYVYPAKASGGLFATAEDVARFVSAGMTGPYFSDHAVLDRESIKKLYSPRLKIPGLFGFVADFYGFGYFIEHLSDGRQAVWHGGQGHGWMTHFHAVPESGDGIVILTNSQRSWPFMARVLTDWSQWLGIEPVKMGRIAIVIKLLWALIGLVVLVSLLKGYRLFAGLLNDTRRFAPFFPKHLILRALQFAFGMIVIAAIVWSAAQPYLFISSVFPHGIMWAVISLLALSIISMISACLVNR